MDGSYMCNIGTSIDFQCYMI